MRENSQRGFLLPIEDPHTDGKHTPVTAGTQTLRKPSVRTKNPTQQWHIFYHRRGWQRCQRLSVSCAQPQSGRQTQLHPAAHATSRQQHHHRTSIGLPPTSSDTEKKWMEVSAQPSTPLPRESMSKASAVASPQHKRVRATLWGSNSHRERTRCQAKGVCCKGAAGTRIKHAQGAVFKCRGDKQCTRVCYQCPHSHAHAYVHDTRSDGSAGNNSHHVAVLRPPVFTPASSGRRRWASDAVRKSQTHTCSQSCVRHYKGEGLNLHMLRRTRTSADSRDGATTVDPWTWMGQNVMDCVLNSSCWRASPPATDHTLTSPSRPWLPRQRNTHEVGGTTDKGRMGVEWRRT